MSELPGSIEAQRLTFRVRGLKILDGITFSVAAGETIGIIGPNGSGKTTLFNCLSGFNRPQAGAILMGGIDITRLSPARRARAGLGRVFQNSGVFREMTLLENLITALEGQAGVVETLFPWSAARRRNTEKAMEYLTEIGLQKKAHDKASNLSGGQLRLLEIVRTLAFGAQVFLLDEPTAGVSPKMKEEVVSIIQRLKALGKTILVIEHDINFIQKFVERILVLNLGQLVMDDTPQKVRDNPQLQEIYFGSAQ